MGLPEAWPYFICLFVWFSFSFSIISIVFFSVAVHCSMIRLIPRMHYYTIKCDIYNMKACSCLLQVAYPDSLQRNSKNLPFTFPSSCYIKHVAYYRIMGMQVILEFTDNSTLRVGLRYCSQISHIVWSKKVKITAIPSFCHLCQERIDILFEIRASPIVKLLNSFLVDSIWFHIILKNSNNFSLQLCNLLRIQNGSH